MNFDRFVATDITDLPRAKHIYDIEMVFLKVFSFQYGVSERANSAFPRAIKDLQF